MSTKTAANTKITSKQLRAKKKRVSRSFAGNALVLFFLLLMSAFMVLPLFYTVITAFKPANELFLYPPRFMVQNPTIDNFTTMMRLAQEMWVPFERYLFNSLFIAVLGTLGYVIIASMAAFALGVSSLMSDCEGKPLEIFIGLAYSLLPFILGTLIVSVITNFLSLEVKPFVTFFQIFYIGWTVVLVIVSMMQINQLTLKKTLLYLLLVVIAMVIILVLIVLLYALVQQFWVFLQTLYSEIMYRI